MRYIKLPVEVTAERLESSRQVKTREGVETASEGDWLVTGAGGEQWPVKDKSFTERYEPMEMQGRFLARPIVVDAIQLAEAKSLPTAWGIQSASAGDWLITNSNGSQHICDDEAFQRSYKLAADEKTP